jgi:hypothetical protein
LGATVEITVQDNFGVERGQILKVAQSNRLCAAEVDGRQVYTDVLIVAFEVLGRDFDLTAAETPLLVSTSRSLFFL